MIFRKMKSFFRHIMDELVSVYWNFALFPPNEAVHMPLKVSYKVDFVKVYRGCFDIQGPLTRHMIKIGEIGANFVGKDRGSILCENSGKLIFYGPIVFAEGTKICVENGKIEFGRGCYLGCNTSIQCQKGIKIGDNFLGGWNLCIRDTDGHVVTVNGVRQECKEEIKIEDDVWVASDCTILKGSYISKGSIVGCRSLVCGYKMNKPACLLVGSPAKIKKENVKWEN